MPLHILYLHEAVSLRMGKNTKHVLHYKFWIMLSFSKSNTRYFLIRYFFNPFKLIKIQDSNFDSLIFFFFVTLPPLCLCLLLLTPVMAFLLTLSPKNTAPNTVFVTNKHLTPYRTIFCLCEYYLSIS